jgi:hypothetical protein
MRAWRNKNFIEYRASDFCNALPQAGRVEDHAHPAERLHIGGQAALHAAGASCMMRALNFIHSSV